MNAEIHCRRRNFAETALVSSLHRWQGALALLLFACLFGCGSLSETIRGYGHSAAHGFAEGMPKMKEPAKKLVHDMLLEGDTLKEATDRVTTTAVLSLTRELADAEVQKRVDGLVEHTLQLLGEQGSAATRLLLKTAGPELREALRNAVIHTMNEAGLSLREALEKQLTPATEALARRTSEVLVQTLVNALQGQLGEKLEQAAGLMGQRLITEATSALAAPTSKSAVAEFTESATRGAIRGAHEQMSAELPQHIQAALIAALVVMGAILLGGAVALFSIWRRYQKSTTSLAIVAEKINQYESKELKDAIQQGATQNHVGPWLSHFLKNRGL